MSDYYNIRLTGVDTSAGAGPQAFFVAHPTSKAGDIVLSATVEDPGSGLQPVNADVTTLFNVMPLQAYVAARNVVVSGVADISGVAVFQQGGANLNGAQILLLVKSV